MEGWRCVCGSGGCFYNLTSCSEEDETLTLKKEKKKTVHRIATCCEATERPARVGLEITRVGFRGCTTFL